MYMYITLRVFEAWAKLAQQWLVCVPLGIHLEPINKELLLLGDNIIIINYAGSSKRELCIAKLEALWANGVPYKLNINNANTVFIMNLFLS